MPKPRLLIVDDEESVLKMLMDVLTSEGYEVRTADNATKGLQELEAFLPRVVLMDIRMPGMDGLEALKIIKKQPKPPAVVLMTAFAATETAITAIKEGAYDYIIKPFNIDNLIDIVKKAYELVEEQQEVQHNGGLGIPVVPHTIIGNSEGMQQVYKTIGRVADKNVTVLILGESGTGKEMVAHAIHINSNRKEGPLVKVNCAAIPENLLESELFGHEKGAFTGAVGSKMGKFELADGGTIFLDEIGEMPTSAQVKLLRVLQEREIERVGGTSPLKIDVRIIAATNRDLEQDVKEGIFREDLFYRLNVVPIMIPALRQRKEDIPMLIEFFARKHCGSMGRETCTFSPEAMEMLQRYNWPGNVRELENVCERAMVMAKGEMVIPDDIPYFSIRAEEKGINFDGLMDAFEGITLKELSSEFEKQVILKALNKHNWNRTQTAETLGLNRRSLYAKMKELSLL